MSLSLVWKGSNLDFVNGPDGPPIDLRSSDPAAPSPMQVLAYAAMGCMAMDVVHILQKGRHDLRGLAVSFHGERAAEVPKRYTAMHLHFDVTGNVPLEAVTRALELSHQKYCSVSNSLRTDIAFTTSAKVHEPRA
jgi:putative redox protein